MGVGVILTVEVTLHEEHSGGCGRGFGGIRVTHSHHRRVGLATPSIALLASLSFAIPFATTLADDPPSGGFVNFESPHVHPMDRTPGGQTLLVCNTSACRVEVFAVDGSGVLTAEGFVPVGLDPVTVRARTNSEVWVVNHVSDSISIIDLNTLHVVRTLDTDDEPCDVVFAGSPQRAFVTCQGTNSVLVFDPSNLSAAPVRVAINGERPRALAVSPDGASVYAAIFESGNATTILGGGVDLAAHGNITFPPNAVSDPTGPYGGQNPPPNSGTSFNPPLNPGVGTPPPVGLIVRKNAAGQWMDDNNHDWTSFVTGADSYKSGRPVGWDMPDRDLAVIDAATLTVNYATGLMTMCMGVGVNPATGAITVVGTEALNQIRFEPVLRGTFLRVEMATVSASNLSSKTIVDLNPHLTYTVSTLIESERERAIGDPRAIVWNAAGTRGFVAGMGSDNLIVINPSGARIGATETIGIDQGPTGLVINDATDSLYILSRFTGSVTVLRASTEAFVQSLQFFDPTPAAIKLGRPHLYGTHRQSGLGQAGCASCHVDGRIDRLAWDLGDPSGSADSIAGMNLGFGVTGLEPGTTDRPFVAHHPMKGPMVTQTLQDIIGHEPFHWRGDRASLHNFLDAFFTLQGAVYTAEMDEFADFLTTMAFPPNPHRTISNTLPSNLALPGHQKTGRFGPNAGEPLPDGNAVTGIGAFRDRARKLDGGDYACVTCHTLPTGLGSTMSWNGANFLPFGLGPLGESRLGLVTAAGVTNVTMKVPQLRNLYQRTGFTMTQTSSNAGFGYGHDGSIDTIERFLNMTEFLVASDQETADLTAFLLAFSGSALPVPSTNIELLPPGPASNDVPASVGTQLTLSGAPDSSQAALLYQMFAVADSTKVGLVAHARVAGEQRGYVYMGTSLWQADRFGEQLSSAQILALAGPGAELTYMVVPAGSQTRLGVDRDLDGCMDGDENGGCICLADFDLNEFVNGEDFDLFVEAFYFGDPSADVNDDTFVSGEDFDLFVEHFEAGC